jgi:IS605 OrfB family transposase
MSNIKYVYRTQKQKLKNLSISEYIALKALCRYSKDMCNICLYNVRQEFFNTKKYLSYTKNYNLIKDHEVYKLLGSTYSQKVAKKIDADFKSFFELIKLKNKGQYDSKVNIPKYLDKEGYFSLINDMFYINDGVLKVPMSREFEQLYGPIRIQVPNNLLNKEIVQIEIVPMYNCQFFEIHYTYKEKANVLSLNKDNVLSIDVGLNNLCTCTTNTGAAFIIDGKYLKSINQLANKLDAYYSSILNKQGKFHSKRLNSIWNNRNNKIDDYLNKAVNYIIKYCIENDIGTIIIGYNTDITNSPHLGKVNNQNFINISIGQLRTKLSDKCNAFGINFIEQEESYTSKASFIDEDPIPVFNELPKDSEGNIIKPSFSGKRIHRGMYRTKEGILINADVNGSLNIMRKPGFVDFSRFDLKNLSYIKRIKVLQVA